MALRFIWFMALAFALVATVTFAGPAGEDDDAAMAAEKEYVTDPSTGKQVVKPEYGGTITAALLNFNVEHADAFFGPPGAFHRRTGGGAVGYGGLGSRPQRQQVGGLLSRGPS